ncbi:MAG: glycosyltransferase family 39 protein [Cyanobacteria bacterium]|nr:glycosyltransferase family 39 protein [Cyanobacteriota bacterium]
MRSNWLEKFLLIIILIIAVFLRFYDLSLVPPSPSLDEASIGYNAYSIMTTGNDEYGYKIPLLLRAYDDWRPALYVYLVIPFIKLFGLNVFAVRLPSVLMSISTVIAVYFLAIRIYLASNNNLLKKHAKSIALLTAFLLAISPWHIYISRLGHEVNAGLTFFILGLLFTFKKKYFPSALFYVLSFVSYQAEKLFIPIFLLSLLIIFFKDALSSWKKIIVTVVICLILLIPFLNVTFSGNGLIRLSGTSIFNQNVNFERSFQRAKSYSRALEDNNLLGRVIYSPKFFDLQLFLENYLKHFDWKWLFFNSGAEPHKIPNLGLLYYWEIPFILIGFIFIIFLNSKIKWILLLWFFSAPLASSMATQAPHAMRSFVFLPTWQIFSAIGIYSFLSIFKNNLIKKCMLIMFLVVFGVSIYYLFLNYFYIFPIKQSDSFQYALSSSIKTIKEDKYDKIIISNKNFLYQSYMFFLFNSKYDPIIYQIEGGTKSGGYNEDHYFGKYQFRPIDWEKDRKQKNTLFIGNVTDFSSAAKVIKKIYNLDGEIKILVVES